MSMRYYCVTSRCARRRAGAVLVLATVRWGRAARGGFCQWSRRSLGSVSWRNLPRSVLPPSHATRPTFLRVSTSLRVDATTRCVGGCSAAAKRPHASRPGIGHDTWSSRNASDHHPTPLGAMTRGALARGAWAVAPLCSGATPVAPAWVGRRIASLVKSEWSSWHGTPMRKSFFKQGF